MKKLNYLLLSFITIGLFSCGEHEPTFSEKLENALASYYKVDSVDQITSVDTVFVQDLDSAKIENEKARELIDISLKETPIRLDSAKANLENAKKEKEAVTFDMLLPFWEENIKDWENIITMEEENLANAEIMDFELKEQHEFIILAKQKTEGNKAYYLVETNVKNATKLVAVSPAFEVFYEFSETSIE